MHAHGHLCYKPYWEPIQNSFFGSRIQKTVPAPELSLVTCNNGHKDMGCFERSLAHIGLTANILGSGVFPWINGRDKPRLLAAFARQATTEYILYADSRDAILMLPPTTILERFRNHFACDLLFGGDRLSWPASEQFRHYEDKLKGADQTEFKYLNGGCWIGKSKFVADFFSAASACVPVAGAVDSEQGLLRQLLPFYKEKIAIDYRCEIFLNIGFLFAPNVISIQDNFSELPITQKQKNSQNKSPFAM